MTEFRSAGLIGLLFSGGVFCGTNTVADDCAPGWVPNGDTCVQLCNDSRECGECELCEDNGTCQKQEVCDPCDNCNDNEVCYGDTCMPACDPVDGSCDGDLECVQVESLEFCSTTTGFSVSGAKWGGIQTSQAGGFVVRGSLVPCGGPTGSGPFVVRDTLN